MAHEQRSFDVVIVGAGIAGLTAARELTKCAPHLKIAVLEARERVGGRLHAVTLKTDGDDGVATDRFDIGGQWVGVTQYPLVQLLEELNIDIYPQFNDGLKKSQFGGTEIETFTAIPPIEVGQGLRVLDIAQTFVRLEHLAKKVPITNPFQDARAVEWNGLTVAEWLRRNSYTRYVRDAVDLIARVVFGISADRLSFLWFLSYGNTAGKLEDLLESQGNGAQGFLVDGCMAGVCERIARDLGEDIVFTDKPVVNVDAAEGLVTVLTSEHVFETFKADRLILALPPNEAGKLHFSGVAPLPNRKRVLFDGMPQGNYIKSVVTYKTPFWRRQRLSGESVSSGRGENGDMRYPLMSTFDATNKNGSAALVCFIHSEWGSQTRSERRECVIQDLVRFFGAEAEAVLDYTDCVWADERFSAGCPVGSVVPGNMESFLSIREPFERVHWCGTETATKWTGYVSGGVQSGQRAAHEVLHHLCPTAVKPDMLTDSVLRSGYTPPEMPRQPYSKNRLRNLIITLLVVCIPVGFAYLSRHYIGIGK